MNEKKSNGTALALSMKEIEKRCVKHQKQEVEAKRQLTAYQDTIVRIFLLELNIRQVIFFH